MATRNRRGAAGERGIALVIAILSLMILTFLGLALAAVTSTELQIATNYRWGQQALFNAEAGIEAARLVIARSEGFQFVLPDARAGSWTARRDAQSPAPPAGTGAATTR